MPYQIQIDSFIELPAIDSTNNYALSLVKTQKLTERQTTSLHGTVVFAHEQLQGKGQRGKKWLSAPGENLLMSLILDTKAIKLHQQFLLSAFIATKTRHFVEKLIEKETFIKWPNDIYIQDKKAGGILIENILAGSDWKWAVAGIGININQKEFDASIPNAISINQITGLPYNCKDLAAKLSKLIIENFDSVTIKGEELINEYNQFLFRRGQQVRFKKENRLFEAQVIGVNTNGKLIVNHSTQELFSFGEIEWII
ncbi:MAG TPA: biotin--[acetyl-CoA-carboxylase] ligase [Niabella sp.]|nr:biotin--[acetyl-CoA-carboxylase] ligase [Chitinophagaceae bacterium]HRN47718.1 biotin--[acetyl-CoA-carboxylase] ligase [Niabella sp.]HRO83832.1 biotin--[acetyl-CoA-carboxylase] ligase [Niabella sp.]